MNYIPPLWAQRLFLIVSIFCIFSSEGYTQGFGKHCDGRLCVPWSGPSECTLDSECDAKCADGTNNCDDTDPPSDIPSQPCGECVDTCSGIKVAQVPPSCWDNSLPAVCNPFTKDIKGYSATSCVDDCIDGIGCTTCCTAVYEPSQTPGFEDQALPDGEPCWGFATESGGAACGKGTCQSGKCMVPRPSPTPVPEGDTSEGGSGGGDRISFPEGRDGNSRQFRCKIPTIVQQPQGLTLFEGEQGVLSVEVENYFSDEYDFLNGARKCIPKITWEFKQEGSLKFKPLLFYGANETLDLGLVSKQDSGTYRALITVDKTSFRSAEVVVSVKSRTPSESNKHHIVSNPSSVVCDENSPASFEVRVKEGIFASYEWEMKRKGAAAFERLVGSSSSKHLISQCRAIDVGKYRVKVTVNGRSEFSEEASLLLSNPNKLKIVTQPVAASLTLSAKPTLRVSVSGGVPPYSYQWERMRAELSTFSAIPGANGATYTPESFSLGDVGTYRVIVRDAKKFPELISDEVTVGYNSAAIKQVSAPEFVVPLASRSAPSGSSVTLTPVVVGSGPISYSWYANGVEIIEARNKAMLTLPVNAQSTTSAYTLSVGSSNGTTLSKEAYVSAISTPKVFVSLPEVRFLYSGQPAATAITFSPIAVGADSAAVARRVLLKSGETQEVGLSISIPAGITLFVSDANSVITGPTVIQSFIPALGKRLLELSLDSRFVRSVNGELKITINENQNISLPVRGSVVAPSPSPSPRATNVGAR